MVKGKTPRFHSKISVCIMHIHFSIPLRYIFFGMVNRIDATRARIIWRIMTVKIHLYLVNLWFQMSTSMVQTFKLNIKWICWTSWKHGNEHLLLCCYDKQMISHFIMIIVVILEFTAYLQYFKFDEFHAEK